MVAPIRRQNMFKPGMGAWWWCRPKQHARVYRGSCYQLHGGHILTSKPALSQKHHKIHSCQVMPCRSQNQPSNTSCSYLTMKVSPLWSATGANKDRSPEVTMWSHNKNSRMIPDVPLVWWLVKSNNLRVLDSYHIEVSMVFPDGLVPREMTPLHVTTMLTCRGGGYWSSVCQFF